MVGFNENDKLAFVRQIMIDEHLKRRGINDLRLFEAFVSVPREEFVSDKYYDQAYDDNPLPIGMGQTISQPYIVALMTEQLDVQKGHNVLEIGTGCGYQTAILSKLAAKVYTIERLSQLSEMAQAVLGRLSIDNVIYYIGDGSKGWHEQMLFDRILISALCPQIPKCLINQLKVGGKIIAPVETGVNQELILGVKEPNDKMDFKSICGVRFVKLIGEYGYQDE